MCTICCVFTVQWCAARKGSFCRVVAPFKQLIKLYPRCDAMVGGWSWKKMNSSWKIYNDVWWGGRRKMLYIKTTLSCTTFVWYLLGIKDKNNSHLHIPIYSYQTIQIHISGFTYTIQYDTLSWNIEDWIIVFAWGRNFNWGLLVHHWGSSRLFGIQISVFER